MMDPKKAKKLKKIKKGPYDSKIVDDTWYWYRPRKKGEKKFWWEE